jgi:hypothetical protein
MDLYNRFAEVGMKRWSKLTAAMVLSLALVSPAAVAQEVSQEEEGGELVQVTFLKVNPPDVGTFVQAVGKIVEAAKLANLGAEFGWNMWSTGPFDFAFTSTVGSMAEFDDPGAWMRQYAGTEGEAALQEAFGMFSGIQYRETVNRVEEYVPAWSRSTEWDPSEMGGAHVAEVWLRPGSQQAFDEAVKEYLAFMDEMGSVWGHRPRVGGSGQHTFVTPFDSQENFYGVNSFERIVKVQGAGERMQELMGNLATHLLDARVYDVEPLPALSYMGPEGEGGEE